MHSVAACFETAIYLGFSLEVASSMHVAEAGMTIALEIEAENRDSGLGFLLLDQCFTW